MGVRGGVADELRAHRGTAELSGGGVHRSDADVVDVRRAVGRGPHGRVDLTGGVGGEPDEHVGADDLAHLGYGHVGLPNVDTVGAHGGGDVGAVVEDEQRAVGVARVGRHARGFGEELVLQVLLAQLNHVDAAGDRGGEEVAQVAIARHAIAHEVQARSREARAALLAVGIGYGPQVGHRGQSDTCARRDPPHRLDGRSGERRGRGASSIKAMGASTSSTIKAMDASNSSTVDLAILGGGIVGLSVAWRARLRGMSVAVLERDTLGAGATHVAAGMLAPVAEVEFGQAGRRLLDLGLRSARMWPHFAAELEQASEVDVGMRRSGTLVVARDEDEARELERQLAFRESLGLRATRLRASEAREREPALAPTVRLALEAPDDHSVDPRRVVVALRRACEQTGVRLREHVSSAAVELDASGARVVGAGGVRAKHVVVAAGAWSGEIAGLPTHAGVAVRPVKGQIMRLRDPAGPGMLDRVVRFEGGYLVPRGDGGYVLGATMEERGFEPNPTAGGVYELLRDAHELVPGVSELHIEEIGVGYRPGTPDNVPLIGPGALEGLTWATGHHRNGILLAPLTAELVMEGLLS